MIERRSPWVVLGIPFPADKAAAKRAFARRSREIRKDPEIPWSQEDLGWAEAEITLASDDPEGTVAHYRVPADSGAYERPREGDLFVPEPLPLPRRTHASRPDVLDEPCALAARGELLDWLSKLTADPNYDPYAQPPAEDPKGQTT